MLIQVTKKFIDTFKIDTVEIPLYEDNQYKWYGHLFTVNRRNLLVLMNVETSYYIVLYSFTTRQLKAITKQLNLRMREALLNQGLEEEIVARYFAMGGKMIYSKTENKYLITKISNFQEYIDLHKDLLDSKKLIQVKFMERINNYYVDRQCIVQRFFNCLYNLNVVERVNAFEVISGKAKFILYEDFSFDKLAVLIQPKKKYLFEFYSKNGKLKKGVCSELRFKYQKKMKRYVDAHSTLLKDLLYQFQSFYYVVNKTEKYLVEVKRVIYDYPKFNENH